MTEKGTTRRWVAVGLVWLVPVGFFFLGTWPFGLFPALLLTLWVFLTSRHAPRS